MTLRFALAIVLLSLFASSATAQRARPPRAARRTDAPVASLSVTQDSQDPHRLVVRVDALGDIEFANDRRWLTAELRDARGRRVTCTRRDRPRGNTRTTTLRSGAHWAEWMDVRELCWGRALTTLEQGGEVVWTFTSGRAGRTWVARTDATYFRSLPSVTTSWRAVPSVPAATARAALVELAPTDARTASSATFRLRVRSSAPERAFVRREYVSFEVRSPSGHSFHCAIEPFIGRPLPDFFSHLSERRAVLMSLSGHDYCGAFREPGVYEVTPIITLTEDGEAWGWHALTGTFRGAPAALRVASPTYVEQPWSGR